MLFYKREKRRKKRHFKFKKKYSKTFGWYDGSKQQNQAKKKKVIKCAYNELELRKSGKGFKSYLFLCVKRKVRQKTTRNSRQ